MLLDTAFVTVNNKRVDDVVSYDFDSDLYLAADGFEFSTGKTWVTINAGDRVGLWVNDQPALTGFVTKAQRAGNKRDGLRFTTSGTDMMGMLTAHCSNVIGDIVPTGGTAVELSYLVRLLLSDMPGTYIRGMKDIVFLDGSAGLSISFEHISASPGQTVFEILRAAAQSRGLLFWCNEAGKLVFGKPLPGGLPEFNILRRSAGAGNNVIDGRVMHDIEEGFSKVIVYSQSQDGGAFNANNISATASLAVPAEFPFYRLKTVQINGDKNSPDLEAKRLINQVKAKLFQFEYIVPGHSQAGKNYRTNAMARIHDEELDVYGDFLIYSRKFRSDKESGPVTLLRLGLPGVVFNAS